MNFNLLLLFVFAYAAIGIAVLLLTFSILRAFGEKDIFKQFVNYSSSILIGTFMYPILYVFLFLRFTSELFAMSSIYGFYFVVLPVILFVRSKNLKRAETPTIHRINTSAIAIVTLFLEPLILNKFPVLYETAFIPLPWTFWRYLPLFIVFFTFYELKREKVSFAKVGLIITLIIIIITTFTVPVEVKLKPEGSIDIRGLFVQLKTAKKENATVKYGRALPFIPLTAYFNKEDNEKYISFVAAPGNVASITGTLYSDSLNLVWLKDLEIPLQGKYVRDIQIAQIDDKYFLAMPLGNGNKVYLVSIEDGNIEKEITLKQLSEDVTYGTIVSVGPSTFSILNQPLIFKFDATGNLIGKQEIESINFIGLISGFAGYKNDLYAIDEKNFYVFEDGKMKSYFAHNLKSTKSPVVDKDGRVFVAARNIVYELKDKTFSEYFKLNNAQTYINSIFFDENNNLYAVCTIDKDPSILSLIKVSPDRKILYFQDISSVNAYGVIMLSQSKGLLDVYSTSGFFVKGDKVFIASHKGNPSGKIEKITIHTFKEK